MDSNAITVCLPVDETEERSLSCVINLKMGWVLSFILAMTDASRTCIHPYMYTCVSLQLLMYILSVKRNLSLLQSDIHWNPLHQNDSYLDTD